jgi:hypothetical protein
MRREWPVAGQYPADDQLFPHRTEAVAVHGPRRRVVRRQPPAAIHAPRGALDEQETRTDRMPRQHHLPRTDPLGAAREQPVAWLQRGQHRALGDLDAQQRPAVRVPHDV